MASFHCVVTQRKPDFRKEKKTALGAGSLRRGRSLGGGGGSSPVARAPRCHHQLRTTAALTAT